MMSADAYLSSLNKLTEISSLEDGWNGYGAEKFTEDHIKIVQSILFDLSYNSVPEPEVFPTGRNSIQLEWETDEVYVEAEVYEDGRIETFTEVKNVTALDLCNWVTAVQGWVAKNALD